MANAEHLELLRLGADDWNRWYRRQVQTLADLTAANLRGFDLSGLCLTGALLRDADLRYATLVAADCRGADLRGARLDRADLSGTRLDLTIGLTQEQVDGASGNEATTLPDGLRRPEHWAPEATVAGMASLAWHPART